MRPGVYSARYAGEPGDDEANNRKLLDGPRRRPRRPPRRGVPSAPWRWPTRRARSGSRPRAPAAAGSTREPRGASGFGYDPLFLIPEYHKTFGELSPLVKHQLSHRARAFARLRPGLDRLIVERRRSIELDASDSRLRKRETPPDRDPGAFAGRAIGRLGRQRLRRSVEQASLPTSGCLLSQGSQAGIVVQRELALARGQHALRRGQDRRRAVDDDTGTFTQTSTGTCLQTVRGTQTVLHLGHLAGDRHRAADGRA